MGLEKRITVILGGTFGLYYNLFREIDEKFGCKIMRNSVYKLQTKMNNVKVDFYICNCPVRDKNYYFSRTYLQSSPWKELIPPPASEIVKKVKESDVVLFFGYCGTFMGNKTAYTPGIFKEVFFGDGGIMAINNSGIAVKNEIRIKNILAGKINAAEGKIITSNLTLAPYAARPDSKEKVIELSSILSDFGDAVDKESYQVVKYFKDKIPLGIYLQSSDVLASKRHMMSPKGMEINRAKFNKNIIKAMRIALDRVK